MRPLARWREEGGPDDAGLRQALEDARRGPSASQLSTLSERVAQRAKERALQGPPRAASGVTTSMRYLVVGLCALGLVLGTLWLLSAHDPPAAPRRPSARAIPVAPAAGAVTTASKPAAASAQPGADAPAPGPAAAPPKQGVQRRRATPASALIPPDEGLADEIALLRAAQRALAAEPARSLLLAEQHERRFAAGTFAEERRAIRIEALWRLGRREQAERELSSFQTRYPQSTYRQRLLRLREAR